jgi:DNA repair exonuclease SbcCD nuclease subunit
MKYLVFSDLHLTNSNPKFYLNKQGVSHLLVAQSNFVQWLCKKVRTEDYDGLLFLGDWTDAATLDPIVQTYSNDLIKCIAATDKFSLLIEGNHCVLDKGNVFTVLGAADKLVHGDNVNVVLNQRMVRHGGVDFHCFPYISDYDELERQIAETNERIADSSQYNVMLFHFPTKNAMLDNGMPSPSGVNLGQEITSNFDLCLGGDFHRAQEVHEDAHYVGAPFDLKFGEHYKRSATELVITEDGYELNTLDNPVQYNIRKMDVDDFLSTDWTDEAMSQTVMKVTGEATADQRIEVEGYKEHFYRLTAPLSRESSSDKEVRVDVIEENGQKDVDLIRAQMVGAKVGSKVQKRAVEIFEEVNRD